MAKGLVTTQYLSDIASAIRTRGSFTVVYKPSQMASAILSIPHDTAKLSAITITNNGIYTPAVGIDGFNEVTVNVSGSSDLIAKQFIERTLPSKIEYSNVSKIASAAFYNYASITKVSFINATRVDTKAFAGCLQLSEAYLPKVSFVGIEAFASCQALKSVYLPSATRIGNRAFADTFRLTSIDLPGVSLLDTSAFGIVNAEVTGSSYYMRSISIPNCTSIGSWCFANTAITNSGAFRGSSLVLPRVSYIGESAFASCPYLATVDSPALTEVGYYAFYYCKSLTSINLANVRKIWAYALGYCNLFDLGNLRNCTYIGNYAFAYNRNVRTTTIYFADTISYIGNGAFLGCSSINTLYFSGVKQVPTLSSSYAFQSTGITQYSGSIFVPASLYNAFLSAPAWSYFARILHSM